MKKFIALALLSLASILPAVAQKQAGSTLRNGASFPTTADQTTVFQLTSGQTGLYQCSHAPTCTTAAQWLPLGGSPNTVYAVGGTEAGIQSVLASNTVVIVPPGTYTFATPLTMTALTNASIEFMPGVTLTASASMQEMLLISDNGGASAGNVNIHIHGPVAWNGNSNAADAILVQSTTNVSKLVTVDGWWTATGFTSHVMRSFTPEGSGVTKYLTELIQFNEGTCTSLIGSCARFESSQQVQAHKIRCPETSMTDSTYCVSGNGVDEFEFDSITAYDYFSAAGKGGGAICVFCSNGDVHDSHLNSKFVFGDGTCASNVTCATGLYLDTCIACHLHSNHVQGGTIGARIEVNGNTTSEGNHYLNNTVYGEWFDTRTGSTSTDAALVNALTAVSSVTVPQACGTTPCWTGANSAGAPPSTCVADTQTSTVTFTATGTPTGIIFEQDLGSAQVWYQTPYIELCINTSVVIPPGVLEIVLGNGASFANTHTTIVINAGLQPGGTTLKLWDKYWPMNWNNPGVRWYQVKSTAAVPTGVVITVSQLARINPDNDNLIKGDQIINAGEDGIVGSGPMQGFLVKDNVVRNSSTSGLSSHCAIRLDNTLTNPGGNSLSTRGMAFGRVTGNDLDQTDNLIGGTGVVLGVCLKAATGQTIDRVRVYANLFSGNGYSNNFNPGFGTLTATNYTEFDQGQCTMVSGSCGAQPLGELYHGAPLCFGNWTGTGTLAGTLKFPTVTGPPSTVTPSSSTGTDTAVVNWFCQGN